MRQRIALFDDMVLGYLRMRMTLIAALLGIVLFVLAIIEHDIFAGVEVLLAGAVGYTIGFVPAVLGGVLITLSSLVWYSHHSMYCPSIIFQFLGCVVIAWLGRSHHSVVKHTREHYRSHVDQAMRSQVVPWTLVNEVRNSLLGMRLLLFTNNMGRETDQQNLQIVEAELLRLESLFTDLHEEQVNPERMVK